MKFDLEMHLGGEHYKLIARGIDTGALEEDLDKVFKVRQQVHEELKKRKLI